MMNCIMDKKYYIPNGIVTKVPDYVARMIEEHKELVTRIVKLHSFIYDGKANDVDRADFANTCIQLKAMKVYEEALRSRLINAGIDVNNGSYSVKLK